VSVAEESACDAVNEDEKWWWRPFLHALAATGNVSAAAKVAGVSRTIAYRDRRGVDSFALEWEDALEEFHDHLQAILWQRAMGQTASTTTVRERLNRKGEIVRTYRTTVTKTVSSDKALTTLLEWYCPEFRATASRRGRRPPWGDA
jgi:hypothetical protein